MQHLEGKVAVITGATGGIGLGVARQYVAEGATVVVSGRDPAKCAQVAEELRALGGKASFFAGNVLSRDDMVALAAHAVGTHGRLDVLVASAAGIPPRETAAPHVRGIFNELQVDGVIDVVSKSIAAKLNPLHAALPYMIERQSGSCIFITSEGGRSPTAGQTAVALHSGGLVMATKVLGKEMGRHMIRVNCIAVTLVGDSPSWDAFEGKTPLTDLHRAQYARIGARAPLGIANPQDIGAVAVFLGSDGAKFITGSTVSPTGGLTFH